MRFLLLMWSDDLTTARGTDEDLQAWVDFQQAATDAGVYVDGAQLTPPGEGRTLTTALMGGAEDAVRTGPASGRDAQVVGYYLLECPDVETATAWAHRLPLYGDVEVRQLVAY
jgi:hypothetical protein